MRAVTEKAGLLLIVLVGAALGGCKPQSPRAPLGRDLDSYLAALHDNESDLRAAGVSLVPPPSAAAAPGGEAEQRPLADAAEEQAESAPEDDEVYASEAPPPMEMDSAPTNAPMSERQRPRRVSAKRESRRDAGDRCDRICDLAEMACELEARICELAAEHVGEQRYVEACDRAQQQCDTAANACRSCC